MLCSLSLFYVSLFLFLSSLIPSFLSPLSSLSPSLPELLSPYRKHRDTTFFSDTNDSVDSVDVGKQAQVVLQIRLREASFRSQRKTLHSNAITSATRSNLLLPSSNFKVCVCKPGAAAASEEQRGSGPEAGGQAEAGRGAAAAAAILRAGCSVVQRNSPAPGCRWADGQAAAAPARAVPVCSGGRGGICSIDFSPGGDGRAPESSWRAIQLAPSLTWRCTLR